MEKRPHPTHDQTRFHQPMAWFGVVVTIWLVGGSDWEWISGIVFMVAFLKLLILMKSVNRCHCPTCGESLSREVDSTEFPCERCKIVWTTEVFGG